MKKAMIALVSIALLVGLAGCGGQPAAGQQPASSAASEPTYATHLNIKCDENLLFSKYDVEVLIDEETVGELDHGTEKTFEVNLEAGSHTLKVCNVDERGVDGSQEFSVSDETIVDCKIACTASQVEIHEFSAMTMAEKAEADKKAQEEADRKAAEEAEAKAKEEEAKAKEEQEKAEREKVITAESDPDFAAFLVTEDYEAMEQFVEGHKGRIIEFDGNVADVARHGTYKTRFDYLIYTGDYSATSAHGPIFRFEDVSYYDLKLVDGSPDTIPAGLNLHIKAEIVSYGNVTGLCELDPIQISVR